MKITPEHYQALARQISRIPREPRDSISETREEVPGPKTP